MERKGHDFIGEFEAQSEEGKENGEDIAPKKVVTKRQTPPRKMDADEV